MKVTVWIARDIETSDCNDGELIAFSSEPIFNKEDGVFTSTKRQYGWIILDAELFPQIKNGEVRKAKIVLEGE